jgi:hypothetical protein
VYMCIYDVHVESIANGCFSFTVPVDFNDSM